MAGAPGTAPRLASIQTLVVATLTELKGAAATNRPKVFTTMTERRAAAAKRAAAASECAVTATAAQPADPPLRMELLHAARYLPPGTIPHIENQLIKAFSHLLPAFDAVVQRSERENDQDASKMWSLLGIDTDFRLDSEQDGGIAPLVLEANVSCPCSLLVVLA